MDLRDIARALKGEVSGQQVLAPGPNHSARDRSLSVYIDSDAPDGFVVHSFAGDDPIKCKDYVREAIGLSPWKPNGKANGHVAPKARTIVAHYVYETAEREPYLRVTRWSDKSFTQSHWDGSTWRNGKPAGPKIPYRLPDLLADQDSPVFVVEGEKAADYLRGAGLLATTSSEGAGKWTADVAAWLTDRDVFVIADNDEVGRKHAAHVLASLPNAKKLELDGLAPKAGADDWLADGRGAGDLLALVFAEPETPEPSPIAPTPFAWTDPHDIPRREWLYGHHLIRRYVSTTISPGGLGKSSLLMAEAIAMATGKNLIGDHPSKQLKVWYWNGEDDQDENRRRVAAICLHHNVRPEDLGDRLFLDTGREKDIMLATADGRGFILNSELLADLERQIISNGIDVLIIDPFVASHNVGENDNMAINGVIRALARIAEHGRCAIELVHHVRKPGGGVQADTDVNDARGASSLIGGVRSARVLNVMSAEEAERLGVEKRFSYFRVDNGKANLAPRTENAVWRHIVSVDLDNGGELSSDHVGVVTEWHLPGVNDGLPSDIIETVQSAVRAGNYRYDPQSPDWLGHFVGVVAGIDSTDKNEKKKLVALIDGWLKNDVLRKEVKPDSKRMPKPYVVVGGWEREAS